MITKAVVFAAGAGTRMQRTAAVALTPAQRDAAAEGHKALMPVGRPFLDYVLWAYAEAGITALCLVVRPDASALRARYADRQVGPLRVHFAEQATARGTADALWSARAFIGDDHVLTGNGDNLYPVEAIQALVHADGPGLVGFSVTALVERGNVAASRLGGFALLETDAAGDLTAIHEKPGHEALAAAGATARFSMNLWALPPVIVEACTRIAPSARGEYELPDAVRWTMRDGGPHYRVHPSDAAVLDLSQQEDVPLVTERLRAVQLPW